MFESLSTDLLTQEFKHALDDILNYWKKNTIDEVYGGFVGKIDSQECKHTEAEKGSVLNARILWSFSAAYNFDANPEWLVVAQRSFNYIKTYFIDYEFGGVYWSVDYRGLPLNTKKQSYALSFAIYGLSEFYKATQDHNVINLAIKLYQDLECHALDQNKGGYFEAFTRTWQAIEDSRLSDKDANERKTMNTHLHILEAYTNLYQVWPDAGLKMAIAKLINIFSEHMLQEDQHLGLFFDEDWKLKSDIISYGHDIEAAWLIQEAAETIGEDHLLLETRKQAITIAQATVVGIDIDGGLRYEFDNSNGQGQSEKHWWVQAEGMVGFLNAYQLSGEETFLQQFLGIWKFTKEHLIDADFGEWFWGVYADHSRMTFEDKVGFWKCPYHNSRACMEIIKRLS